MKLTRRMQMYIKTLFRDMFAEEDESENAPERLDEQDSSARLGSLLDEAQRQLDALRMELANAAAHRKRIALAQQQALRAGQGSEHLQALEDLARECELHEGELRSAVSEQQNRLDGLRRRHLALSGREKSVAALDELMSARQALVQRSDSLQAEFAAWEEQIARREDRLAARQEWSK